ncbi:MAG: hypothetical protein C4525_02770 [Desulfarculus sp.]|jgi:hypothetical protein|nr:MAG: hypothetical protein C4525_02770 [Desulfarculus sp.]
MRYYGREGAQCELSLEHQPGAVYQCKKAAHALLFGRVPRGIVTWLGLGLMLTALVLGLWGLSTLKGDKHPSMVRDQGSALIIRR